MISTFYYYSYAHNMIKVRMLAESDRICFSIHQYAYDLTEFTGTIRTGAHHPVVRQQINTLKSCVSE